MRKRYEARERRKVLIRNLAILIVILVAIIYLVRAPEHALPKDARMLFEGGFGSGLIDKVGFSKDGKRIVVRMRMGSSEDRDTKRLAYVMLDGGMSVVRAGGMDEDFESDWTWMTGEDGDSSISLEPKASELIRGRRAEKTDGGVSVLIPSDQYEVPWSPRFSRDGQRAAWSERDGVYVADGNSGELFRSKGGGAILRAWTQDADGYPGVLDWTPAPCAFSPRDRAVAYYRMVDTIGGRAMGFVFTHLPKFGLWKGLGTRWKKHLSYGIAAYDIETGKRRLFFEVPGALREVSSPLSWQDKLNYVALDWSPDGQWLAFTTDGGARLWIAPAKVHKERSSESGQE